MDDVEEDLAVEGEAALPRLARRRLRRDDELAQEVVLLVLEREADDVGRSRVVEVVGVDPGDLGVVHQGDRETGSLGPALVQEDEAGEGLDPARSGLVAGLAVGDLDRSEGVHGAPV